MTGVEAAEVLHRRIVGHHLAGNGLATALDVVRSLTCVQSQEWAHGFWSIGRRTQDLSYADVRAEFDAGAFVRTHILRPTWHYVAAEDLRWIQAVTADRVQQLNGTIYRREGLGPRELDRGVTLITRELTGGNHLTRAELSRVLDATGFRMIYLIMNAEVESVICSGPIRGAQHTYALVDERIPDHHDGDAAELAHRFFAGHGPASVKDFARWSSLTQTQSQDAVDGAADRLESEVVEGITLYSVAAIAPSTLRQAQDRPSSGNVLSKGEGDGSSTRRSLSLSKGDGEGSSTRRSLSLSKGQDHQALLLPLYDELTLSYPMISFPRVDDHPHPPGVDRFIGSVIIDRVDIGTWRRTVKGKKMIMELFLAPGVGDTQRRSAEAEAQRMADFLGLALALD